MSRSVYLVLTQLTVILHMGFILFVVIGGFFTKKRLWLRIVHSCCVIWAIYITLASGVSCPLTTVENYFGYRAGLATFEDDFITRYLVPVIYQEGATPNIQLMLVVIVICINVVAYSYLIKRKQE